MRIYIVQFAKPKHSFLTILLLIGLGTQLIAGNGTEACFPLEEASCTEIETTKSTLNEETLALRLSQIKTGIPVVNHPKDSFREGELFIKINPIFKNFDYDATSDNHDTRALALKVQIAEYGIYKIEKAFPLLESLNTIFKIKFTKTEQADQLVSALQERRFIEWAEKIPIPKMMYTPNDVHANQWQFDNIQAYDAWDFTQGSSSVVVAVVDDAVLTTHNDLAANIVAGADVADGDTDPNPPASATANNFSHGTHAAGLISAVTDNGSGIAAIGGNVKIMPIKCKPDAASGLNLPFAYEGIEYAVAQNVDVINMSWAVYSFSAAMQALVEVAYNQGIFLVSAGGNDGVLSSMYPANYVNVMGIGASDQNSHLIPESNWGAAMDILAPGRDMYSTVAGSNDAYASYSGTSTACALVAGLAGLMLSYDGEISPKRLRQCIRNTADDVSSTDETNPNFGIFPTNRLNAFKAMECLNIPPFAYFTVDGLTILESTICPGTAVQFFNESLGPDITAFEWTFEGGTPATSTDENPIVTFDLPGVYEATLTVTNAFGTDTEELTVSVFTPSATLSGDTTIASGYGTQLFFDFTGAGPWSVTYTDGVDTYTIDDITDKHLVVPIPALESQNWEILSVSDRYCDGVVVGGADITVIEIDPCTACPYHYIQNVLIGGACVNVFNVTYTGLINDVGGTPTYPMIGEFDAALDNLDMGFDHGVIMANGNYTTAFGPSTGGGSGDDLGQAGDPDLSALAGVGISTYDACVVEFDFIPSTDTMRFNYVFGSEEYTEFVDAGFNDVFAFFLSGPGIAGTVNIAQIPGTAIPVAIDNVNPGDFPAFYVDNEFTPAGVTEYDGYTVPLEAIYTGLIPCEIYHIKLAIADAGDGILDSGVFLEAKSFNTGSVTNVTAYGSVSGTADVYEGCETGFFEFRRGDLTTIDEDYVIPLSFSGTAIMGPGDDADYAPLPDEIVIPAGDTTVNLGIFAYSDGIAEGIETVIISLDNEQCDCTSIPVLAVLLMYDNVVIDAGEDHVICKGESVQLGAFPTDNVSYEWGPAEFLDDPTIPNPIATPDTTFTFGVRSIDSNGCEAEDLVTVFVLSEPVVEPISIDTTLCTASTIEMPLGNLSNVAGYTYEWSPTTGLDDPYSPQPIAQISGSIVYNLTVTNAGGCQNVQTITINAPENPVELTVDDIEICNGGSGLITAPEGFATYEWSNGESTNVIEVTEVGNYSVIVTNDEGCTASTDVDVTENPTPIEVAVPDAEICFGIGDVTILTATAGFATYEWSNGATTDAIEVAELGEYNVAVTDDNGCFATATAMVTQLPNPSPVITGPSSFNVGTSATLTASNPDYIAYEWSTGEATPSIQVGTEGTYSVSVTSSLGCKGSTSFDIEAILFEPYLFPNAFSPNDDGVNDEFGLTHNGNVVAMTLMVFNRWGNKIYESNNLNERWDGRNNQGLAPLGVYVYHAQLTFASGETALVKGNLTLIW